MDDMIIVNIRNDVFLPQGRYPENFMLISQSEVCKEGGGVIFSYQNGPGIITKIEGTANFDLILKIFSDLLKPNL